MSIAFTIVLSHMERFSFFCVTKWCLHMYFVGIVSGNALGQFSRLFMLDLYIHVTIITCIVNVNYNLQGTCNIK